MSLKQKEINNINLKNSDDIYFEQANDIYKENYVDILDIKECIAKEKINWKEKKVYIGVDLSNTFNNTGISMVAIDENKNILVNSFTIIAKDLIQEKIEKEKIDYNKLIEKGKVIACPGKVVDEDFVINFISKLKKEYEIIISAIGVNKLQGLIFKTKLKSKNYQVVELDNSQENLYDILVFLKEKILKKEFKYNENELLEINFFNCVPKFGEDIEGLFTIVKKNNNSEIDMVLSLVNAVYLAYKKRFLNMDGYKQPKNTNLIPILIFVFIVLFLATIFYSSEEKKAREEKKTSLGDSFKKSTNEQTKQAIKKLEDDKDIELKYKPDPIISNEIFKNENIKTDDIPKKTEQFDWEDQAYKKAKDYIKTIAFSKNGLIDQLESCEKFTKMQAKQAVQKLEDYKEVNWDDQAYKKAKDYIKTMAFSKNGLIDQLESFEKFTKAQAKQAVQKLESEGILK